MNTKLALTAIVTFAVILGVSAIVPSALASNGSNGQKTLLCHTDPDTGEVSVINVNDRALPAHFAHGDVVIDSPLDCAVTPDPDDG